MKHKHSNKINTDFRYTHSSKTNITQTFVRVRKQLAAEEKERSAKVKPLRGVVK